MEEDGASKITFTTNLRVLLVDNNQENLLYTAGVLESCSYQVMQVQTAISALSTLLKRKDEFDVVLADINLPDMDVIQFLRLTTKMDMPALLMSADIDVKFVCRALENGALHFLEKPVCVNTVKYLWQYVKREQVILINKHEGNDNQAEMSNGPNEEMTLVAHGSEENSKKDKGGASKKRKARNLSKKSGKCDLASTSNGSGERKIHTIWTMELHGKFMEAVNKLGEGECYPKDIMDLMNVPGLTRKQVASHLQKCRNNSWRNPDERNRQSDTVPKSSTQNSPRPRSYSRKFGSMPNPNENNTKANDANIHDGLGENSSSISTIQIPTLDELLNISLEIDESIQSLFTQPEGCVINQTSEGPFAVDPLLPLQLPRVPQEQNKGPWSFGASNFLS